MMYAAGESRVAHDRCVAPIRERAGAEPARSRTSTVDWQACAITPLPAVDSSGLARVSRSTQANLMIRQQTRPSHGSSGKRTYSIVPLGKLARYLHPATERHGCRGSATLLTTPLVSVRCPAASCSAATWAVVLPRPLSPARREGCLGHHWGSLHVGYLPRLDTSHIMETCVHNLDREA
jgi:hypothetical protein